MMEPWMVEGAFQEWMARVDAVLAEQAGLLSEDLPDCCYRDWYDDGLKPWEAAEKALDEAQA